MILSRAFQIADGLFPIGDYQQTSRDSGFLENTPHEKHIVRVILDQKRESTRGLDGASEEAHLAVLTGLARWCGREIRTSDMDQFSG